MNNWYYLGNQLQVSNNSEGLLNLSGLTGTIKGSDSIKYANNLLQPTMITPIAPAADAAKSVTGTVTDFVAKGSIRVGFMWFAFVLILLGLVVIAFKNDVTKSVLKAV